MSFLSYMLMALLLPQMKEMLAANPTLLPGEMAVTMERMMEVPRLFYAGCSLLYALSLTGVILMWNLRPSGFHCYTLAQLLLLVVPVLFLGREYLGLGDCMMTILFVGTYYLMLRGLGVFNGKNEEQESVSEEES